MTVGEALERAEELRPNSRIETETLAICGRRTPCCAKVF